MTCESGLVDVNGAPLVYRPPSPHDFVTHPSETNTGPPFSPADFDASTYDWLVFVREVQASLR